MLKAFGTSTKKITPLFVAILFFITQVASTAAIALLNSPKADAAPICTIDTAGANDEPGQKDLTKLCVDYAGVPSTVSTTWNWDETGTNGANTMDACNLFDTDGDGNINYAVCVTTNSDPAVLQSTTTYSCGDTKIDRCTSTAAVVSSGTTSCAVSQQNTDPFPTGSSSPKDTQGACTIQLSTVGGASAKLIDVCSYPSAQPNSDPSDCVIARNNAGKLEVIKNLLPNDNPGLFNLQIDSVTKAANVGHNGTSGEIVYTAGNHTVGETAGTNTSLAGYSTTVVCKDLNGTGAIVAQSTNTSATVPLADDADVVCIITNTAAGSITIVKDAIPNNAQNFGFTTTGTGLSSFTLDDDADPTLSNTQTFNNLSAGSYSVAESAATGWSFDSISCSQGSSVVKNGSTVTINLTAGQNVTCTYTNRKNGTITVNKVTNPANSPGTFPITASADSGSIIGEPNQNVSTAQSVVYDVTQGQYDITEGNSGGWAMTGNTCENVVVSYNDLNKTCTITNTKYSALTIIKDAVPNNAQDFSFSTSGNLSGFILDDDADATLSNTVTFNNLLPDDYSVTEQAQIGWSLTGLTCTGTGVSYVNNKPTVNVAISAGQNITCTFTNTQLGSISGLKFEDTNNNGAYDPGEPVLQNWNIFIDSNGNGELDVDELNQLTDENGFYEFVSLLPDTYSVLEEMQTGWTQTLAPAAVELSAGENSTDNNFGNFQHGSISGYKFNDRNGNALDDNEPHLSGWTINIYNDNDDPDNLLNNLYGTDVTDGSGNYEFTNLPAGTYSVCEVQKDGWVQTLPASDGCHLITIDTSGETNSNTNFGNQGRGTITVKKNVDTDGDGKVDETNVSNWIWNIDESGDYATGTTQGVAVGTYDVSEEMQDGYSFVSVICDGDRQVTQATTVEVTVNPGDVVECTFTNSLDAGTLTVIKQVNNNYGGTADSSDFTVHVKQNDVDVTGSPSAGSETGTEYLLPVGDYEVSEESPMFGYAQKSIYCDNQETGSVSLTDGSNVICTITNEDIAPKLTAIKHVINDNSGEAAAGDFTINVEGTDVSDDSFPGSETGTVVTLDAGKYNVDEDEYKGYNVSYSEDCDGEIGIGQEKTCTVTNNDVANPKIELIKTGVDYAYEGDEIQYNFEVKNIGDEPLSEVDLQDNLLTNVTYVSGDNNDNSILDVGETWAYTGSYLVPNPQDKNVLNEAEVCAYSRDDEKVCNDDDHEVDILHPSIDVKKDGPLFGYEGQQIGYSFIVTNTGDITLKNVSISDDIATNEVCEDNVLAPTESTNCTAIYIIPTPQIDDVINTVDACGYDPLQTKVCNDDDHTLDVIHPAIEVVKSGPSQAHEGDKVTYRFDVTNKGDIALYNVDISDDVAGIPTYEKGDVNDNEALDIGETWTFAVEYTIPIPQIGNVKNTVKVCADDPLKTEYCNEDDHELDVLHPEIKVVKSGPENAYEGEKVTYNFTVTNEGDVPLYNVDITDDVAGVPTYVSGDTNENSALDLDETWNYTVEYTIPSPQVDNVKNRVDACGADVLEKEVCDKDYHELDVWHPTIKVKKIVETVNQYNSDVFDLQIDGQTVYDDAGNYDSTDYIVVTPGEHQVGEVAGNEGVDLGNYIVEYSKECEGGQVNVIEDQSVTCVITNIEKSTIKIEKDAIPNDQQDFEFTIEKYSRYEDTPPILEDSVNSISSFEHEYDDEYGLTLDDDYNADGADNTYHKYGKVEQLKPGWYVITEQEVEGWDIASIDCGDRRGDETEIPRISLDNLSVYDNYDHNPYSTKVYVKPGEKLKCKFVNVKRATVTIVKDAQPDSEQTFTFSHNITEDKYKKPPYFPDLANLEGLEYESESPEDFSLVDDGVNKEQAQKTFSNIETGKYGRTFGITEHNVDGWIEHNFSCDNEKEHEDYPERGDNQPTILSENNEQNYQEDNFDHYFNVKPGQNVTCTFVNQQTVINITKSNNKPAPTVVGDNVIYSLVVTVPEQAATVYDTVVTDLPPENFDYVPGSWTAQSSVRGDLKAGGITTEPTYGSPGDWQLGDMVGGEVVVLNYSAKIQNNVTPGIYPDIAFVQGMDEDEGEVLGNVTVSDTPFVGTNVEILEPSSSEFAPVETLANTGSNLPPVLALIPAFLLGLTVYAYRRSRRLSQEGGQR